LIIQRNDWRENWVFRLARTIRSLSCHNFLENVSQPVHSSNGRLSSPIRSKSPVHENASRERLDYTDLEGLISSTELFLTKTFC